MTWHFANGDWTEYIDCVCGHPEHGDEDCPEQVRLGVGASLSPCGCDDYTPTQFDSTARIIS